jgi:hypothetical protein
LERIVFAEGQSQHSEKATEEEKRPKSEPFAIKKLMQEQKKE